MKTIITAALALFLLAGPVHARNRDGDSDSGHKNGRDSVCETHCKLDSACCNVQCSKTALDCRSDPENDREFCESAKKECSRACHDARDECRDECRSATTTTTVSE